MASDLDPEQPQAQALPDGVAYQQIMDVFEHECRPLRARDLCLALDLPVMPKHVEGTRAKLKRLVSLGFLDETEPGLFQHPRPRRQPSPPISDPDPSQRAKREKNFCCPLGIGPTRAVRPVFHRPLMSSQASVQ